MQGVSKDSFFFVARLRVLFWECRIFSCIIVVKIWLYHILFKENNFTSRRNNFTSKNVLESSQRKVILFECCSSSGRDSDNWELVVRSIPLADKRFTLNSWECLRSKAEKWCRDKKLICPHHMRSQKHTHHTQYLVYSAINMQNHLTWE